MHETFIQEEPAIWKPFFGEDDSKNPRIVTSINELKLMVGKQLLYEAFPIYQGAFKHYSLLNPNFDLESVPIFFPRFQKEIITAVHNCDDLSQLVDSVTPEPKRIFEDFKDKKLDETFEYGRRRLLFDDDLALLLRKIVREVADADKATARRHVAGDFKYSENSGIYSGLLILDEFLDKPFFGNSDNHILSSVLKKYESALFTKLYYKVRGIDNPCEGVNTKSDIPQYELKQISQMVDLMYEQIPNLSKGNPRKSKKKRSRKKISRIMLSTPNGFRKPQIKTDADLEDYQITHYFFTSLIGEYAKKNNYNSQLFTQYHLDEIVRNDDVADNPIYHEMDEVLGTGNAVSSLSKILNSYIENIPVEAREYVDDRLSYNLEKTAANIGMRQGMTKKQQKKLLSLKKFKLKAKKSELESKGIYLPRKQFIENLSFLYADGIMDDQRAEKAVKEFKKMTEFFNVKDVRKFIYDNCINLSTDKISHYFPLTSKIS